MGEIIFSRHLDEIDDLRTYGRDAPLLKTLDNYKKLQDITESLRQRLRSSNKKSILFISSPRIRAIQTAELIAQELQTGNSSNYGVDFLINNNLRATEQGEFILPDNYKAGSVFKGLKLANDIFTQEAHGSDYDNDIDNIDYRFGDPVLQSDKNYKYPELSLYFRKYGDSYRESLIRIYTVILTLSEISKNLFKRNEVVVITHGQIYHVFKGMMEIAQSLENNIYNFRQGDSAKLLWDIYKNCGNDQKVTGIYKIFDLTYLKSQSFIDYLSKELNFLRI